MPSTYPGAIQTFTNPGAGSLLTSPDHANQHTTENDTLGSIQTTLGTTPAGTLFSTFAAADKPARQQGGTFQQVMFGTLNLQGQGTNTGTMANGVYGTATWQNGTIVSPVLNVSSDAQGDIYYRNSGGNLARLAPGVSGQFLQTQGAAANPTYAYSQQIIFRDFTTKVISNSSTLGTLFSGTVPAGIMGTNSALRVRMGGTLFNNTGGNYALSFIMNLGANQVGSAAYTLVATTGTYTFDFQGMVVNVNATNSQKGFYSFNGREPVGGGNFNSFAYGTANTDTTVAQVFSITSIMGSQSVNAIIGKEVAMLELVP